MDRRKIVSQGTTEEGGQAEQPHTEQANNQEYYPIISKSTRFSPPHHDVTAGNPRTEKRERKIANQRAGQERTRQGSRRPWKHYIDLQHDVGRHYLNREQAVIIDIHTGTSTNLQQQAQHK